MTEQEISGLHNRKLELRLIEISAHERLDYVNSEKLKNNLRCDHKYPDGRWAESSDPNICSICGCGMGYDHYIETK